MPHYRRWKTHGDPLLGRFAVPFHERATVCSIENCEDPVRTRGWCRRHYQIWLRTGDPLTPPKYTRRGASIQERIEASVVKTDTCWFWIKHTNHDGYGVIGVGGRLKMAHRVSYEAFIGPIPESLVIDHVCRNRACVRPDPAHLEPVTHLENVRRGDSMKRASHCCHGHEFTPENTSWKQCCRTCERASRERSKTKERQR
jgi:hypothetical protein